MIFISNEILYSKTYTNLSYKYLRPAANQIANHQPTILLN